MDWTTHATALSLLQQTGLFIRLLIAVAATLTGLFALRLVELQLHVDGDYKVGRVAVMVGGLAIGVAGIVLLIIQR